MLVGGFCILATESSLQFPPVSSPFKLNSFLSELLALASYNIRHIIHDRAIQACMARFTFLQVNI